MIYHHDDPDYLQEQLQRIAASRERLLEEARGVKIQRKKEAFIRQVASDKARQLEAKRKPGCPIFGLFMVVALAWCFVACGPSRHFKDQAADVLDVARQLHDAGCESEELLQQDLCDKAYYTLVSAEPGLEDEIAKKRRLQAMWETLEPVVWPYVESGVLTAAQLLLAYITGNILGQALETVSKPP